MLNSVQQTNHQQTPLLNHDWDIGYLIPEFPGQTHIFLWREYQALADLGIKSKLLSSKKPPKSIRSHDWSEAAQSITSYLFPLSFSDLIDVSQELLKAGPRNWLQCLKMGLNAPGMSLRQKLYLFALIPFAAKLVRFAKTQGWSHVHVPCCGNVANIAMLSFLLGGPTYSLALLGPKLDTYGPNQEQKWKYASFGLFQSEQLYQEARSKLSQFLPKAIDVAPVGVNLDTMKRQALYLPWNGHEACKIYSCGRLNPIKGHIYLIKAVKILRQQGIDAQLKIGGEDEQGGSGYRKVIEKFIQENSLTDYVELLGAVSEKRNRQAYEEAHIYAMGSLDEAAGAVAAMEAMAMEAPVVMTSVGATAELIEHNADALLVPPENPEAMAEAMISILQDKELALRLGKAAREKISAKFSHRRSAEKISDFLSQLTTN
ncbi:MAG: exopolysaccharide biosynthesis GT4 family glycosyltransferase EpsE [Cyanobacteria bacterium P01_B01_bin.77]